MDGEQDGAQTQQQTSDQESQGDGQYMTRWEKIAGFVDEGKE